jgi:putative peptide zinc metalloprotease protein
MNLVRALDVALPEIPARTLAERYPRLEPGVTFREHVEDGKVVVRIYVPSKMGMYKFPRALWKLVQLFDGKRSYEQIAELYSQQVTPIRVEDVREIASNLEAGDFWYTTPQEKNILLLQQTQEVRKKKVKQQREGVADLSVIVFPAFNPDRFVTWLHSHTRFFYKPWFTLLSLAVMAFGLGITVSHWAEIGRDTLQFYTFSTKTWADIAVMYGLAMIVVAVHELGHAHACKHYGGRVPAMGFALVYLTPAFYTDTTEGAVKGTPVERFVISLAGIWIELLMCSVVTPIWWASQPETVIHEAAYFLMLLTGIISLLVNWNPLMKLDGYYMLCEVLGIADLKEDSTAYVSAWLKRRVWRLPVEVPYVPKRRRLGFVVYALTSGLYSYTVLYVVARFAGNVFRNFSSEWSFIPELGVAAVIFRSRIRLLSNFLKFLFLDKKDKMVGFFKSRKLVVAASVAAIVLLVPIRHDSARGRFVLEAAERAVIRAQVPGFVTAAYADEGQTVSPGQLLIRMRNVSLQSKVARAEANYTTAASKANLSVLNFAGVGPALVERELVSRQRREVLAESEKLNLISPIAGVVVTSRVSDHVETFVVEGEQLVEIARIEQMKARIYVPEYEMHRFTSNARGRLQVEGIPQTWDGEAASVSTTASEIDPVLTASATAYRGLNPPQYYVVDLFLANPDGRLKPGMVGSARLYGVRRRSLFGLAWRGISEFIGRKVW